METLYVHRLEVSIVPRWQFFPNWSICSTQSLLKSQEIPLKKLTNWSKNLHEDAKEPEKPNKFGKNRGRGLILPNSKLYYKSIVIKTVWHCLGDRYID